MRPERGGKKTRTREHIVGDLAVNHVERQVLLRGYTLEPVGHDYGYDAIGFVYNKAGEPAHGVLLIQIKGTDSPAWIENGQTLAFRLERRHLIHWLSEPMPVILCVYDAPADVTHWLYVQNYFGQLTEFNLFAAGETVTVRIPREQKLTPDVLGELAEQLERIQKRLETMVLHD